MYIWHAGYWGPHVGYYGGINYGFGYFGSGYEGGYWEDGVFFYNTAVTRVDTTVITHIYNKTSHQQRQGETMSASMAPAELQLNRRLKNLLGLANDTLSQRHCK